MRVAVWWAYLRLWLLSFVSIGHSRIGNGCWLASCGKTAGWLFATEVGAPINPRTDWAEWKRLLKRAGMRDGRLHDARHTAATVLLLLGVSERTIMGVMGWSNTAMAHRYAHVVDPIRNDVAQRVDGLLVGGK